MKFDGTVIAVILRSRASFHTNHREAESMEEAGEIAIRAGMECRAAAGGVAFNEDLKARFAKGRSGHGDFGSGSQKILITNFRLGLFENPFRWKGRQDAVIQRERGAGDQQKYWREEAMILLKNDKDTSIENAAGTGQKGEIPEREEKWPVIRGGTEEQPGHLSGMLHVHCKN